MCSASNVNMIITNKELRIYYSPEFCLYLMKGIGDKIKHIRDMFDYRDSINITVTSQNEIKNPLPDWVVAFAYDNTIYILDKLLDAPVHYQQEIIIHEFVHLATERYKKNMPLCLYEGVAMYLADQKEKLVDIIEVSKQIDLNNVDYSNPLLYVYSFNITYMLVQKYSLSILVELIKNGCIKKIYNYISK